MKKRRQSKILEIISLYNVETQEELQQYLKESGFEITQATISRDIKELRLVKVLSDEGRYIYSKNKSEISEEEKRTNSIFIESIQSIESAMNTVVVRCYSGMANATCAAIDAMEWSGVVGTIAGDDTIFVLCKNEEQAVLFAHSLEKIVNA